MIPFPMPGTQLGVDDLTVVAENLTVVASDRTGADDELALCLCTTRLGPPYFMIVEVDLERNLLVTRLGGIYNIGTGVGIYHQMGGTVNHLGLDGGSPASYDYLVNEIAAGRG